MEAVAFALCQGRKPLKLAMTAMTRHQKRGMGKGQSRLVFRALDFFSFPYRLFHGGLCPGFHWPGHKPQTNRERAY